jgi:hypothetical protein
MLEQMRHALIVVNLHRLARDVGCVPYALLGLLLMHVHFPYNNAALLEMMTNMPVFYKEI